MTLKIIRGKETFATFTLLRKVLSFLVDERKVPLGKKAFFLSSLSLHH
jgi:hypothetical protein